MSKTRFKHNEYYLQDSRTLVGNCIMWWRKNRAGYTTKLELAHVFTREEAMEQHKSRKTDIPWPKAYVDEIAYRTVDIQNSERGMRKKYMNKRVKTKTEPLPDKN